MPPKKPKKNKSTKTPKANKKPKPSVKEKEAAEIVSKIDKFIDETLTNLHELTADVKDVKLKTKIIMAFGSAMNSALNSLRDNG